MSRRFAVALVSEKGQTPDRPHWITQPRKRDYGSYIGYDYGVTTDPKQAATWAKATTAADWAKRLTCGMPEIREYTAVAIEVET